MKFTKFRVFNYRNVHDSGLIDISEITAFVGQNEAGKSNLFEALYRVNPFDEQAKYRFEEDWPVDKWGDKNPKAKVCEAFFELDSSDISALFDACTAAMNAVDDDEEGKPPKLPAPPKELTICGHRRYGHTSHFYVVGDLSKVLKSEVVTTWAKENLPKFVYISDYEMSGSQTELNALKERRDTESWDDLSVDDQTILIVLELADIDLDDFVEKGRTAEGRTTRSFDKLSASAFLTKQFQDLWRQKKVDFIVEIDATTLNIFAKDEAVGMPVRLKRRSTGFRWYVAFAWKFTHASGGEFENCILLLEEPGIHLHYSAQRDLLKVFERLKDTNTILYTTHLASMVDLGFPERVRIVESNKQGSVNVKAGVVSSQSAPMAVIEMCLGLSGNMSGLLGNRKTLIVEGGDDALIINKLSGILRTAGKEYLSDSIYLWPAKGAPKTPMYAAFAIGQKWQSGVLLDTDEAGLKARKKISELYLDKLSNEDKKRFQVLMIGKAAGINKTDAAIEDLFSDKFYLDLVNEAYAIKIKTKDLPVDGSTMITKRVETVLKNNYGHSELDKRRVLIKLLEKFDTWKTVKDLPAHTAGRAEKLFKAINKAFDEEMSLN